MIRDSILRNRSYRRFYQEVNIKLETMRELVDLARLSANKEVIWVYQSKKK